MLLFGKKITRKGTIWPLSKSTISREGGREGGREGREEGREGQKGGKGRGEGRKEGRGVNF